MGKNHYTAGPVSSFFVYSLSYVDSVQMELFIGCSIGCFNLPLYIALPLYMQLFLLYRRKEFFLIYLNSSFGSCLDKYRLSKGKQKFSNICIMLKHIHGSVF